MTSLETFRESDEHVVASVTLALPAPLATAALRLRRATKRLLAGPCAEGCRRQFRDIREYDLTGCVGDAFRTLLRGTFGNFFVGFKFIST